MALRASTNGHFSPSRRPSSPDRFADVTRCSDLEMRSTGEAMGIDRTLRRGLREGANGGGAGTSRLGRVYISVANREKRPSCS